MKFSKFERGATALTEMTLRRGDEDAVLVFTVEILGKRYHWIVYRPCNYTQVWTDHPGAFAKWSVDQKEDRQVIGADGVLWSGIQDHDSCWTDWDCNVVGIDFQTDVTVLGVTAFTADPIVKWNFPENVRRGIALTLTESVAFPQVVRTGRKVQFLSLERFGSPEAWFGAVYDMTLAFWTARGHKAETFVVSFDASEYRTGKGAIRLFRALHYKIVDGKPVLVGVASDRRGEKIVPRKGTGSIKGDVIKHVTVPFKLAENPGRDFNLDVGWSKMEPKPHDRWPH